jgi:hypothetical protein
MSDGNTTQLWKITPSNEQPSVLVVQPFAMQQFLECWESTRYAFHWCEDPVPPLLQVHSNHQQVSMRWGWPPCRWREKVLVRGGWEKGWKVEQRMNLFVLDLVCHATATIVPLSGGPAGCKTRRFQAAQRPQPAQQGLGYIPEYSRTTNLILTYPKVTLHIPT